MANLWALPYSSRPGRAAGSPEDAVANLALGFRSPAFEKVDQAATIIGGAQALLDAGFPIPTVSTASSHLFMSAAVMRQAVAARGLGALAFCYKGLQILAHAGPLMAGRNIVTAALEIAGPYTYGITAGIAAVIKLQGSIVQLRLQKIGASLGVVAKAWSNELEKRKYQALQKKAQSLEDAIAKGLAYQYQLENTPPGTPGAVIGAVAQKKYWPLYLGGAGLLLILAMK
jgi:hypothetical protein